MRQPELFPFCLLLAPLLFHPFPFLSPQLPLFMPYNTVPHTKTPPLDSLSANSEQQLRAAALRFSPAPFHISHPLNHDDHYGVCDIAGTRIAEFIGCPQSVREANARLFAAAPLLIESLLFVQAALLAHNSRQTNLGECFVSELYMIESALHAAENPQP